MGSVARLSGLYVYPIKSCGGVALDVADLDERGIRHDRRWMLVDEDGKFVSQRTFPRLALVRIRIQKDALLVDAPGAPTLEVPFDSGDRGTFTARVWGDAVEVVLVSEGASRWFSKLLGESCRLVYLPNESIRPVDQQYGRSGDHVGLADGFPLLLISEASLEDLNGRMEHPLPMDRFRPNLVVSGCGAFEEDDWPRIRVSGVDLRVVKPCARCKIPTINQMTATASKEPLRTLARYRKFGSKVFFGQNLIHDTAGTLRLGDTVEVIEDSA